MHTFPTPGPTRLRIDVPAGRVRIVAEATETTRVELSPLSNDGSTRAWIEKAEVAQHGEEIVVIMPRFGPSFFGMGGSVLATVHLPTGSAAQITTGSADVETSGELGDVRVTTGSGRIRIGGAADAEVRTGSGDIEVQSASGSFTAKTGSAGVTVKSVGADCNITTGSGHIDVAKFIGELRANSGSGNVTIDQSGDSLDAFTASGRVAVRRADHGNVRAKTVSGGIEVGVSRGTAAFLALSSVSGRVRSELEPTGAPAQGEASVALRIDSISGSITVARA